MGVLGDSCTILLDLYRVVRNVHCLYPYLCILTATAPTIDQQRNGWFSAQCQLDPVGPHADGFRVESSGLFSVCYAAIRSETCAFLVVLTQLNDVVHYLASLYFGKRKIVPTSNPNITWEGFVFAFPVTIAASYFIYPYLTPFDLKFGIIFGMLISLSGFFGSLTVSVLKRDLLIGDDDKFDALKKAI